MTTTTTELADFMAKHNVTVEIDPQGVRTSNGWEHQLYHFHLDVKGERLISTGTYKAGMGIRHTEPVDVFGSILMDVLSVDPYANSDEDEARNVYPQTRSEWPPNWDEWADDLGMITDGAGQRSHLRSLARDFRDIMCHRANLRQTLGTPAYEQALEIAAEL
jgi:hypothetical protein